ncbi:shikimate kinase [Poseidonocella sedimentorum]|uniref:Shikimate kinase n=2 Tax=Poseidonocella sedimentorum TaxID=871652 RepID=A0A1I6EHZ5_9RHOB|nr:shikimate kinase [Poseidonocella sedimentorum]
MACRLEKTVVMVGMMGAGKSAIGRALAERLGVPFLDSDAEIERAAAMSISEIFARDGESFFRRRETEVIRRLLEGAPCVLSTGGGAFLSERNRRLIAERGVSVWLDADLDLLWARVRNKDTRPLLRTDNPRETLATLQDQRVPSYAEATLRVMAEEGLSIEAMTQRVLEAIRAHEGVFTCPA